MASSCSKGTGQQGEMWVRMKLKLRSREEEKNRSKSRNKKSRISG